MHSRLPENIQYPSQDGEDKADILYLISFYYSLHYSRTTYRLQVYQCGTNLIPNLEDSKLAMRIGHCRIRICWVSLTRLSCILQKLFGQLSCCSGQELSIWQACTAFIPFRLLINHSASFQTVWPAFKPFDLVSKWDNFALLKAGQPA